MSLTAQVEAVPMTLFNLASASEQEYAAMLAFENQLRAEQMPDDQQMPLDELIGRYQNIPSFIDVTKTVVWSPDARVVATSHVVLPRMDNHHLAEFYIAVLPAFRRQGWGRRLLSFVVEVAQREQRRLLRTDTSDRIPAGALFLQRLGATKGLEATTNQLDLGGLDRTLLRQWRNRASERVADFELGCWVGPYPEEQISEIATMLDVINTIPHDDLDVEDVKITPDRLRQMEQEQAAIGVERWTMYVRERGSGKLAGFTDVLWNPNNPQILEQWGTAVLPQYRNRGLGRLLKAAMLEKVLDERPQVKHVRTANADSNRAMIQINRDLGFKPYTTMCIWEIDTARASEYLDSAS